MSAFTAWLLRRAGILGRSAIAKRLDDATLADLQTMAELEINLRAVMAADDW